MHHLLVRRRLDILLLLYLDILWPPLVLLQLVLLTFHRGAQPLNLGMVHPLQHQLLNLTRTRWSSKYSVCHKR